MCSSTIHGMTRVTQVLMVTSRYVTTETVISAHKYRYLQLVMSLSSATSLIAAGRT